VFGLSIPGIIIKYGGEEHVFPFIVAVPSMIVFLGLLSYPAHLIGKPEAVVGRASKQSFLIGVVIFLVSRVFVFTASLVEILK